MLASFLGSLALTVMSGASEGLLITGAQLSAQPVVGSEETPIGPIELEQDPLYEDLWGNPAWPRGSGISFVLTGSVGGHPLRFWFFTEEPLTPGETFEVDDHQPGQLTLGDPPFFISNQVEAEIEVSSDGGLATITLTCRRAEVDQGPISCRKLSALVSLHDFQQMPPMDAPLPPEFSPFSAYTPDTVWSPPRAATPPPEYERRKKYFLWPLVVGGGAGFLTVYGLSIWFGQGITGGQYYPIPVVGPILVLHHFYREVGPPGLGFIGAYALGVMTIGVAFLEVATLAMIPTGLSFTRIKWSRKRPTVSVLPVFTPRVQGLTLRASF